MKKSILTLAAVALGFTMNAQSITIEKDKFSDKITKRTPFSMPVGFTQVINGQDTVTYFTLETIGYSVAYGSGTKVLLGNGDIITNGGDISLRVNSNAQYEYSAFFRIDKQQLKLISQHGVTDYELYVFDGKLSKRQSEKLKGFALELL